MFPSSDHRLASSSPRNLCARPLPRLRLYRGASRGAGPGVGTCPACRDFVGEFLGALDSSYLGLALNLQLSTFNRVSFLFPSSPHLCALCVLCGENSLSFRSSLIPRHSPLTTNSFIIRTSKTPLPQLLYNPHLQAPLGSAGNKGLITPLESALTRNSPVTPVESALTKRGGVGSSPAFDIQTIPSAFHSSPLFSYPSKLFCTFLHLPKTQPFCFHAIPHSLTKTPGGGSI